MKQKNIVYNIYNKIYRAGGEGEMGAKGEICACLKANTNFKDIQLKYPTHFVLNCSPYLHLSKNIRLNYIRFPEGSFPNVTFLIILLL